MTGQEITVLEYRDVPFGKEPPCWCCGKHIRAGHYWLDRRISGQVCEGCEEDGYPWFGEVALKYPKQNG